MTRAEHAALGTGIVGYGYPAYGGPPPNPVRLAQAAAHLAVDGDRGPQTEPADNGVRQRSFRKR